MASYEGLVIVYFAVLTAVAWLRRVKPASRVGATALAAGVVLLAFAMAVSPWSTARAWIPHVYLIAGYWMPALLVPPLTGRRFEEWLARMDGRYRARLPSVPRLLAPVVELAYLLCYPLVPLSFAVVWLKGSSGDIERFWLTVLVAGYGCYATLPWLVSRPPRMQGAANQHERLAGWNARVLDRVSHRLNTFPSGHVAVAAAAALSVAPVSAPAAVAIGAVVVAITIGAAAGRYHYVVDVALGLVVAGIAALVGWRA